MNDLISRQALMKEFSDFVRASNSSDFAQTTTWNDAVSLVGSMPSAQPELKKGRWLPDNRPGGGFWVCSECKFPSEAFAANVLYKFCPNCGAKMQKGGE